MAVLCVIFGVLIQFLSFELVKSVTNVVESSLEKVVRDGSGLDERNMTAVLCVLFGVFCIARRLSSS